MGAIREVRKRDDRVVPFDETKIVDAIYKATRAVGRGDRPLALELGSAVTHFLEKKFQGVIPGIEDIQDQVETVLIETGHAEIAKAYILYRNKRATVREILQVRKAPPEEPPGPAEPSLAAAGPAAGGPGRPGPELVEDRGGIAPWSKKKIAAALLREADLEVGTAEEVASAVERKVFSSGMRRISTSLIRELVDNELFERGFSQKLKRQAPVGLPKYNLEQIIFGTDTKEGFTYPKTPVEVQDLIATRILEQYALQEVFSPSVADAHREGRLHLHGLGSPIRFDRLSWDLRPPRAALDPALHAFGDPAPDPPAEEGYLDLSDFFRRLTQLVHFVAGEIVLRRPCLLLGGLLLGGRLPGGLLPGGRSPGGKPSGGRLGNGLHPGGGLDPGAPQGGEAARQIEWIYGRLAELCSPRAALALDMDLDRESIPWLRALAERPPIGGLSLYLRFSEKSFSDGEVRSALECAAGLFERGDSIEFLPALPGLPESAAEGVLRPAAAPITINLPRAAFRSAGDRRGSIEREIEETLDIAIKGHLERRRFLERLSANRENPLWDLLGRPSDRRGRPQVAMEEVEFPIGILGLTECVKFLTGQEFLKDARALRAGLGIVSAMARKIERDARGLGLNLVLKETRNTGTVRRLEEIDRRRFSESGEIDRGRSGTAGRLSGPAGGPEGARYTDGVRIHRSAPIDPLGRISHLGNFLKCVRPSGLIEDSPELRGGGGELVLCLLEESIPYLFQENPSGGTREASHPENAGR